MELERYDLRDPGRLLADVVRTEHLKEEDLLLALVEDPSTTQRLVTVRRVARRRWVELDRADLSELFREEAEALPLEQFARGVPRHLLMTVRVRRGLAVIDGGDAAVLSGWRYANHFMPMFSSDLMVVTEHGWTDLGTGFGGRFPRFEPPVGRRATLRAV
ncbi:MAG TPA: hypothetical protein VFG72_00245 [Marmoricola sp.]|nr:hypothetical protein [Marmoricola sp.]